MIIGENRTFLDDRNFDRKTIDLDLDVFGKNESRKYKHEQTISNRRTIQDYHTATGYQIQETELTEAETPLSVSNALRHEDLTRAEEARLDEPISFEVGYGQLPSMPSNRTNQSNSAPTEKLENRYRNGILRKPFEKLVTDKDGDHQCRKIDGNICRTRYKTYRSADGGCNNVEKPFKGAAVTPMQRFLLAHYNGTKNPHLPSVRDISTEIHEYNTRKKSTKIKTVFKQWGQFLHHDILDLTQPGGSLTKCCQTTEGKLQEPFCNQATSFIDGSVIYGNALRTLKHGKLEFTKLQSNIIFYNVCIRFHNMLANELSKINPKWDDEQLYQESRKIVGASLQHITYKEFLPMLLGSEITKIFGIDLQNEGYYNKYNPNVDPAISHSFAAAFNIDKDLTIAQLQRARDFGIPPYTRWRETCGLSSIKHWKDFEKVATPEATEVFQKLYNHTDDIDLLAGGTMENSVAGGTIGPTFACIIAQQFRYLRIGDRFWYENGKYPWSFTLYQLEQIRQTTLAAIICKTMTETKHRRRDCNDALLNAFDLTAWTARTDETPRYKTKQRRSLDAEERKVKRRNKTTTTCRPPRTTRRTKRPTARRKATTRRGTTRRTTTTTERPLKIKITNITTQTVDIHDKIPFRPELGNYYRPTYDTYDRPGGDVTYLFGVVQPTTPISRPKPVEVNIKVQYFPADQQNPTKRPTYTNRPFQQLYGDADRFSGRPTKVPFDFEDQYRPQYLHERPSYSDGLYVYKPTDNFNDRPYRRPQDFHDSSDYQHVHSRPYKVYDRPKDYTQSTYYDQSDDMTHRRTTYATKERPVFKDRLPENFLYQGDRNFVKVSSVKGQVTESSRNSETEFSSIDSRENKKDIVKRYDNLEVVRTEVFPDAVGNEEEIEIYKIDDDLISLPFSEVEFTKQLPRPFDHDNYRLNRKTDVTFLQDNDTNVFKLQHDDVTDFL